MKVYAYIKIKENLNPQASTAGDIIYFYPINQHQGKLTLNNFLPVVVDIAVPCGELFNKLDHHCTRCKYANINDCEVYKFTRAEWSAGELLVPPEIKQKRKYKIDMSKFISAESLTLVEKEEKTIEEESTIFTNAINNEQPVTSIELKEVK